MYPPSAKTNEVPIPYRYLVVFAIGLWTLTCNVLVVLGASITLKCIPIWIRFPLFWHSCSLPSFSAEVLRFLFLFSLWHFVVVFCQCRVLHSQILMLLHTKFIRSKLIFSYVILIIAIGKSNNQSINIVKEIGKCRKHWWYLLLKFSVWDIVLWLIVH